MKPDRVVLGVDSDFARSAMAELYAPFVRTGRPQDRSRSGCSQSRRAGAVLLAISCRTAGLTLVTNNLRDFERIRHVERFDFVPPWPDA